MTDTIAGTWQAIRGGYLGIFPDGIRAQITESNGLYLWSVGHDEPEIVGHAYTLDDASEACETAVAELMEGKS